MHPVTGKSRPPCSTNKCFGRKYGHCCGYQLRSGQAFNLQEQRLTFWASECVLCMSLMFSNTSVDNLRRAGKGQQEEKNSKEEKKASRSLVLLDPHFPQDLHRYICSPPIKEEEWGIRTLWQPSRFPTGGPLLPKHNLAGSMPAIPKVLLFGGSWPTEIGKHCSTQFQHTVRLLRIC